MNRALHQAVDAIGALLEQSDPNVFFGTVIITPMASPPSRIRSRPSLTVLAIIGGVAGFVVFSQVRFFWIQHATGRLVHPQYCSLIPPLLVAATGMTLCFRGPLRTRRRWKRHLRHAIWPLAGGIPIAVWQWVLWHQTAGANHGPTITPWPLYLWMALVGGCAWRIAAGIRLRDINPKSARLIICTSMVLMVAPHLAMQLRLWNELSFGYHDIGLHARALYSAAHGRGLWIDSLGWSMLGEHTFFLLWALVPIRLLGIDSFHLLAFCSTACFVLPALIIAWYVRRQFNSHLAAVLGALAWLLLPMHGCLVIERGYGFHPIYLAVPLLMGGLVLTSAHRWRSATVCMLLALLAREDLALTVVAWAVYIAMKHHKGRLGVIVGGLSLLYLAAAVFWVIPHFRGSAYPWIAHHFGSAETHPGNYGGFSINLSFLLTLLLPMAFLSLRSPWAALIALPALIESLLTSDLELHNLAAHYYTPAVPVLFFAALQAWHTLAIGKTRIGSQRLRHSFSPATSCHGSAHQGSPEGVARSPRFHRSARRLRAGWCLLVAAWMGQAYLGIGPHTNNPARAISPPGLRDEIANITHFRTVIPRQATITASYRIAAHFTDYNRLWTTRNDRLGDWVIIDDRDNWDGSRPRSALIRAHRAGGYRPFFADYHLIVLSREQGPVPLTATLSPSKLPEDVMPIRSPLGLGIEWVGIKRTITGNPSGTMVRCRMTLFWTCTQPVADDLRFGLSLGPRGPRWGPFYFSRGAYPTNIWSPGRLYRDDVTLLISREVSAQLSKLKPVLLK